MTPFVVLILSLCSDLDHTFTPGSCAVACHMLCVCRSDTASEWLSTKSLCNMSKDKLAGNTLFFYLGQKVAAAIRLNPCGTWVTTLCCHFYIFIYLFIRVCLKSSRSSFSIPQLTFQCLPVFYFWNAVMYGGNPVTCDTDCHDLIPGSKSLRGTYDGWVSKTSSEIPPMKDIMLFINSGPE